MKLREKQSPAKIKKFNLDMIALNEAIAKIVEDPPGPGFVIERPSLLKYHLLFDFHLQDFLKKRGTLLGGIDEQNVESTHPMFHWHLFN